MQLMYSGLSVIFPGSHSISKWIVAVDVIEKVPSWVFFPIIITKHHSIIPLFPTDPEPIEPIIEFVK